MSTLNFIRFATKTGIYSKGSPSKKNKRKKRDDGRKILVKDEKKGFKANSIIN